MFNSNSGYVGQSMSVRAAEAYQNGEMPLSKWNKAAILEEIEASYGKEARGHCQTLSLGELRSTFLEVSSWHHTGSYFGKTDFYSFDDDPTLAEVMSFKHESETKKHETKRFWAIVNYKIWSGSRNHPHCKNKKGIATWTETDGKESLVEIEGEDKKFRLSSLDVSRELARKPAKNSLIRKALAQSQR